VTLSRRHMLTGACALALAGTAVAGVAAPAAAETANILPELYTPGPLGDKIIGADNAPVTIVEYASVTCPHCAFFHKETFPTLKTKYIDTGKVRLIFREFPTQPAEVAIAGFMLARCAGDKYFPLLDALFEQQRSWASDPYNGFLRIAKQAGFTQQSFEACINDSKLAESIQDVATRAGEKFKVQSTPTFFINDKMLVGAFLPADLEKLLDPLLKKN
jgi:protein-disulfide isomerase